MPDFVRRFFVSCAQISEAYGDEIRVRLAENRPQRQVQERLREDISMRCMVTFSLAHDHPLDSNIELGYNIFKYL